MSFFSFVPLILLTNNIRTAVIRSDTPTIFTDVILSIVSFNNNPNIPAGIVATIIRSAYLKFS